MGEDLIRLKSSAPMNSSKISPRDESLHIRHIDFFEKHKSKTTFVANQRRHILTAKDDFLNIPCRGEEAYGRINVQKCDNSDCL